VAAETPSFARDVQLLFRPKDRDEMMWAFDLWNVNHVRENGDAILDRLDHGDMPCDDRWPETQVETFRTWIAAGMPD
jgi:hypothetical protein